MKIDRKAATTEDEPPVPIKKHETAAEIAKEAKELCSPAADRLEIPIGLKLQQHPRMQELRSS